MREQTYRWSLWLAVGSVIVVVNALDIWGAREVRDWVFGQTGAAWVQAIGSIAAMAVTIGLWRNASTEELRRAAKMCHIFAGQLGTVLDDIEDIADGGDVERLQKRLIKLGEVIAYGRMIKIDALPPVPMWSMIDLLGHAAQAQQSMREWAERGPYHLCEMTHEAGALRTATYIRVSGLLDTLAGAHSP